MKLMILDGNSVINRAFYGVRPLTTRDGLYTNAIYGFLNILEKERGEEKPDALCVAFDLHAPTFRHLRYDGYKATRHPMPEELAMQMPVMKQVLAAMNIPVYACEGWEADDVLGTVGRLCEEAGWDCAILTGDRDSLQLVDEHVSVRLVHTQGGQTRTERYTPDVFRAEYGLEPKRLRPVAADAGRAPSLVLVESVRGAAEGMVYEKNLVLYRDPAHTQYTEELERIYHAFS